MYTASLRLRNAGGKDGDHGGRKPQARRARRGRDGALAQSPPGEIRRVPWQA